MIDFHVLLHPVYKRNPSYFVHPQCIIHKILGVEKHIGKGRFTGFKSGDSKYVSFFDDDGDCVNLSVIEEIIARLDEDPSLDAICTDEQVAFDGNISNAKRPIKDRTILSLQKARSIHHLVVLRRSSIEPFLPLLLDCPDLCEFTLWGVMIKAGCKFQWMSEFGYTWIKHSENARSMKIEMSDFSKKIINEIHSNINVSFYR